MTLTELKNKVIDGLKEMTIDDYYFDPNLTYVKSKFKKEFGGDSDEKIKEYLISRFPETYPKGIMFTRKAEVDNIINKIAILRADLETLTLQFQEKQKLKSETEIVIENFKIQEQTLTSECVQIRSEIAQLKPLEGKEPYDSQILKLTNTLNEKEIVSNNIPHQLNTSIASLNSILLELPDLEKQIIDLNAQIESQQEACNKITLPNGIEPSQIESFYQEETESLEILFKILLQSYLNVDELYERIDYKTKKTGEKIIYSVRKIDEKKEYCEFMVQFFYEEFLLPENWNQILSGLLEGPIPKFKGSIYIKANYDGKNLVTEETYPANLTRATLLSLKMALTRNQSIIGEDNHVLMYLSGGISASIVFSTAGKLVRKINEAKPQFYWIIDSSKNGIGYETLFHQSGIASSEIQIQLPEGFYVVYDNYIITIRFEATPILSDFSNLNMAVPNNAPFVAIATANLIERIEEEERQKLMDDDYD
jgi:hypothetical protein